MSSNKLNQTPDNKTILAAGINYYDDDSFHIEHWHVDKRFAKTIWLLTKKGSGGRNRARIIEFLNSRPANAWEISCCLRLNYKTVRHHLMILLEKGLVVETLEGTYGANYFLSQLMENHYELFADQWHIPVNLKSQKPFISSVWRKASSSADIANAMPSVP